MDLYYTEFPDMYVTEDGYLVDIDGNLYDGDGDLIEEDAIVLEGNNAYYDKRINAANNMIKGYGTAKDMLKDKFNDAKKSGDMKAAIRYNMMHNKASRMQGKFKCYKHGMENEKYWIHPGKAVATAAAASGLANIGKRALINKHAGNAISTGLKKAGLVGAGIGAASGLAINAYYKHRRNKRDKRIAQIRAMRGGK